MGFSLDSTYIPVSTAAKTFDRVQAGPNGTNAFVVPNVALTYGNAVTLTSGAHGVQDIYAEKLTIAASGSTSIDLSGSSSYKNPFGVNLAFITIKYALFCVLTPDGSKYVKVGPQAVANAWQGPWGGVGATVYEAVYFRKELVGPAAGWAVTAATADILPISNSGGANVDVAVFIAGTKT